MQNPEEYYKTEVELAESKMSVIKHRITLVSIARLVVAVIIIGCVWFFWENVMNLLIAVSVAVVVFLWLVKMHTKLGCALKMQTALRGVAVDNQRRLVLDLKDMRDGCEFVDNRHPYTFDLDIFGENSIFALLNTLATYNGERLLAHHLICPNEIQADIEARQQAIAEMVELPDFRTRFRALGLMARQENENVLELNVDDIPTFKLSMIRRVLMWVMPMAMAAAIVWTIVGFYVSGLLETLFFVSVGIAAMNTKCVGKVHASMESIVRNLSIYHPLLSAIENAQFCSPLLQQWQSELSIGGRKASEASKQLARLVSNLDQRYNWLSYTVLNGFWQWDDRQVWQFVRWMQSNRSRLAQWYVVLSQVDELSALATFAYNHPSYVFPSIDVDAKCTIEAEAMGHPLISVNRCVCNEVKAMSQGNFMVVTGANMAGKSTYLRTVGVNYLLALVGAPVFAGSMRFSPAFLFTGLRTSDSLHDNESYFFAELSRLQSIIRRAEKNERMFVILDEILKGTNSVDKQKGSIALVRKLVRLHVTGIIATHDLMLGTLADEFPAYVFNQCFEAEISGNTLSFSYRIQQGVAQNMNAYFLMQQMGIV